MQNITKSKNQSNFDFIMLLINSQIEMEKDLIANLSNISAYIKSNTENINWAGFYLYKENELVLGPFQGNPACNRIQIGSGVCGTAFKENKTILVEDVDKFDGHIACDSMSKSEIVIPININGKTIGVLDIDSPVVSRFTDEDKENFEKIVEIIENNMSFQGI